MKKLFMSLSIIGIILIGGGLTIRNIAFPLEHKELIKKYAKEYNEEPEVLAALIHFETNFKPETYKEGNKVGLLNIRTNIGIEMSTEMGSPIENPKQIAENDTNIKLGAWYISKTGGTSNLDEMMGNWVLLNNDEKKENTQKMVDYAKQYYGKKVKTRAAIYKILYPSL